MSAKVIERTALPDLLHSLIFTEKVRVTEENGVVQVEPVEEGSIDGLIGILADYPEMSVDNFLARMRADKELDR